MAAIEDKCGKRGDSVQQRLRSFQLGDLTGQQFHAAESVRIPEDAAENQYESVAPDLPMATYDPVA